MKKNLLLSALLSIGFLSLLAQKSDTTGLSAGPKKEAPSKPGPKAFADIIIPNDKYNTVAIDVVRAVINQRIT